MNTQQAEETVWAKLICPIPVAALTGLAKMAPAGACLRPGAQTFHEGAFFDVIEVVVSAESQPTEDQSQPEGSADETPA